jgi:histidinol dehydrogenase
MTVQRVTRTGIRRIGDTVMTLASAEGLHAHAASVGRRMK